MALEQFQESCPKRYLEEIDRRDLPRFTAFLISQKKHDPRTTRNKLAVVAQELAGAQTGAKYNNAGIPPDVQADDATAVAKAIEILQQKIAGC